jgi:hypothetical protein
MTMVTIGVTLRAAGDRTDVVVEKATTREAVIGGLNALVYLCPAELRAAALREVARLAEGGAVMWPEPT